MGGQKEWLNVDLWILNTAEKGIVRRDDGYYETEIARLIWNDLVRHHGMVRYKIH
jgi:hypothetical protein